MGNIFTSVVLHLLRAPAKAISSLVGFLFRALQSQLSNEYLVGMVLMAGVTPVASAIAAQASEMQHFIMRKIFTNVRLGEQETKELMEYLRQHPSVTNGSMLTMCTHSDIESDVSGSRIYEYEPELNTAINFYHRSAKTGRGHWIWVANYSYSESTTQSDPIVSTTVTIFGRDKSPIEEMIDSGREMLRTKRRKFLQVITTYNYTQDNYGLGWNHGYKTDKQQPGRSIKSVILPKMKNPAEAMGAGLDQAEALLADAREFLESERWYTERGIPYRRGYLLHGIPGGGKSSLVAAVASELKLPIYMLQLSNELLTDDTLHKLFQTMTLNPSILLLEDIDAATDLVNTREGSIKSIECGTTIGEAAITGENTVENISEQHNNEPEGKKYGGDVSVLGDKQLELARETGEASSEKNEMFEDKKRKKKNEDFLREGRDHANADMTRDSGCSKHDLLNCDADSDATTDESSVGEVREVEAAKMQGEGERKREQGVGSKDKVKQSVESGAEDTQIMMLQLIKQQHEDHKKDREEKKKRDRKITLSGLLNALDGPTATTGRILFMTTNFREKLDPALIRSGRIDYEIEFRHVDEWQAERLFKRFYLSFRDDQGSDTLGADASTECIQSVIMDTSETVHPSSIPLRPLSGKGYSPVYGHTKEDIKKLAKAFARNISLSRLPLSAADLQGHLMKYKSDPSMAVRNMKTQLLVPRQKIKKTPSAVSPSKGSTTVQ